MRCFLAIELPDAARAHLQRVQEALARELPKASYPRPENLHVTLKFLGDVDDKRLAQLCGSMQRVKISGSIQLSAAGLHAFPPRGPARIIVATMQGSDTVVEALHRSIEQRCRKLGFDAEQRRYHPHVTLARIKAGLEAPQRKRLEDACADSWPGPAFDVTEFVLLESRLHPQGSRYVKLAGFYYAE